MEWREIAKRKRKRISVSCTEHTAHRGKTKIDIQQVIWFNSLIASSIKCENKVNFLRCSSDCKCVYVYALCVCDFLLAAAHRAHVQSPAHNHTHTRIHFLSIKFESASNTNEETGKNTEILSELHKSFATWQFETGYHWARACVWVGVHNFIKILVSDFKTVARTNVNLAPHCLRLVKSLFTVALCVLLLFWVSLHLNWLSILVVVSSFFSFMVHGKKVFLLSPCTFV